MGSCCRPCQDHGRLLRSKPGVHGLPIPSSARHIRMKPYVYNFHCTSLFRVICARRYRMRKHVFLRIVNAVEEIEPWFKQRANCTGKVGLSAIQKCVAAIRILAYSIPADAVDEYVRIGDSTANLAVQMFCRAVIFAFEGVYLRAPNTVDVARLLQV